MEQFAVRKENPLEYKPIGLLLVEFAVPATIAVLVNAVYNIVDQIFIGQESVIWEMRLPPYPSRS